MADIILSKGCRKYSGNCELCRGNGQSIAVLTVCNVRLCEDHCITLCLIVAADASKKGRVACE